MSRDDIRCFTPELATDTKWLFCTGESIAQGGVNGDLLDSGIFLGDLARGLSTAASAALMPLAHPVSGNCSKGFMARKVGAAWKSVSSTSTRSMTKVNSGVFVTSPNINVVEDNLWLFNVVEENLWLLDVVEGEPMLFQQS